MAFPKLNIEYIAFGIGDIFEQEGERHGTIKERLNTFLDNMGVGRKEFTKRSGVSSTMLSNMSDNLRNSSLERIYRAFPMLNPEWLEYGEGDMITDKKKKTPKNTPMERINTVIGFLGITTKAFLSETGITSFKDNVTRRTIEKIVKRYPFINPLWLMHGAGQIYDVPQKGQNVSFSFAPLFQQRALADFVKAYSKGGNLDSIEKIPYIEDENINGNIIAIEVAGDSMDDGTKDGYADGDIVIAKEVLLDASTPYKRFDFIIVHTAGILLKRISKIQGGHMTLCSLNKDYEDVDVSIRDTIKTFIVKMRLSKRGKLH